MLQVERTFYPPINLRVAGIFKGGGARGIVYAGALRELRARGIWFKTVAGSSAGAITAALIACGLTPDDFGVAAGEALTKVHGNKLSGFLPWRHRSLYRTDELEIWLEKQLKLALGHSATQVNAHPVTFRRLAERPESIELNVVAMDLDRRQPLVFNYVTTPNCSVAAAVVASCAIPLAMPPGRVVIPDADGSAQVHRLVDGGAWANYPSFVYQDDSFREYSGLPPMEPNQPTLGFVIMGPAPPGQHPPEMPVLPERPDPELVRTAIRRKSSMDRGAGRRAGVIGAVMSWSALRWLIAIALPVFACLSMISWMSSQAGDGFPSLAWLDYAHVPIALSVVLLVIVASSATLLLAIAQLRLAYEAIDVGLPSVTAALSVGTGLPDWVGSANSDRVVRLWSPEQVTTTSFRIRPRILEYAIKAAAETASPQLDRLFPGHPRNDLAELRVRAPGWIPPTPKRVRFLGWLLGVSLGVGFAFLTTNPPIFILIFVLGPAVAGFGWIFENESNRLDENDLLPSERTNQSIRNRVRRSSVLRVAVLLLLLCFVLIFATAVAAQGEANLLLASLLLVPVVMLLVLRIFRHLLASRRLNQRLIEGPRSRRGVLVQAVLSAFMLAAGVAILSLLSPGDAASIPDLPGATVYASVFGSGMCMFGIGLLLASMARLRSDSQAKRYAIEVDRQRVVSSRE